MNTSLPEIEFPNDCNEKVIIAMKGLPNTGKSEIAMLIGEWARSHVLYIDDFLEALSSEKGYTAEAMPTAEEADRLLRLALDGVYKAATRHLGNSNRVVIKSRFSSTLELDLLIRLIDLCKLYKCTTLIIEPQVKNEYRWQSKLDNDRHTWERTGQLIRDKWYKARSWNDFQKAKELADSQDLDLRRYDSHVTRLVLDYFDDAISTENISGFRELTPDFKNAIRYLLRCKSNDRGPYSRARYVAQPHFNELSRYLLEREISKSRERRKYVCTSLNSKAGSCVFKLWEELPVKGEDVCCNVCLKRVASGEPGYTCHFCFLTLHQSCAEMMPDPDILNRVFPKSFDTSCLWSYWGYCKAEDVQVCRSCTEQGRGLLDECESCYYENHLKSGMLPTIINHDCHSLHFLSIHFATGNPSRCKSCAGVKRHGFDPIYYVCHLCKFIYHLEFALMPREVKVEHGGHEHIMKLMYSHDGIELEDVYWCNACYGEMDPQVWFYSCQGCPYYITHMTVFCVGFRESRVAIRNGNFPIRRTYQRQIHAN